MTFCVYMLLTGANTQRICGDEDAVKKLWVKNSTRLFRVYASVVLHSIEEFDGTGWVAAPTLSL